MLARSSASPSLYPVSTPFDQGWLRVPGGGRLYYAQHGRPDGFPVLVFHGGPGSGCSPAMARLFDGQAYRIVLLDQRGAGRSTPRGALRGNRTRALVDDAERLRRALGIERWLVFGGSWGATLALLYAAAYRQAAAGLLLRGLFLARAEDLAWFFDGARALFPEAWAALAAALSLKQGKLLPRIVDRMAKSGAAQGNDIALAWWRWERTLSGLPPADAPRREELAALSAKYRLQAHYFAKRFFLCGGELSRAMRNAKDVPALLVHGRRDCVCRPEGAWRAARALPGGRLLWVEDAGHDPYAPAMVAAVTRAAATFVARGDFGELGAAP